MLPQPEQVFGKASQGCGAGGDAVGQTAVFLQLVAGTEQHGGGSSCGVKVLDAQIGSHGAGMEGGWRKQMKMPGDFQAAPIRLKPPMT
jgi:hypothetical protein